MLLLDEMHVNNTEKVTIATTLLSVASSSLGYGPLPCSDSSCRSDNGDHDKPSSGANHGKNKGRRNN